MPNIDIVKDSISANKRSHYFHSLFGEKKHDKCWFYPSDKYSVPRNYRFLKKFQVNAEQIIISHFNSRKNEGKSKITNKTNLFRNNQNLIFRESNL